jgi:multidrug transporter EmrE-like cation transporter
MYAGGALFGSLALFIQRIPATTTYAIVGGVVLAAFAAIFFLESLPYERQVKIAKPSSAV